MEAPADKVHRELVVYDTEVGAETMVDPNETEDMAAAVALSTDELDRIFADAAKRMESKKKAMVKSLRGIVEIGEGLIEMWADEQALLESQLKAAQIVRRRVLRAKRPVKKDGV